MWTGGFSVDSDLLARFDAAHTVCGMATYVYKCKECSTEVEVEFPMGQAPDSLRGDCFCGALFKRSYSSPAVRLRGGGWAKHPDRDVANRKVGRQDSSSERAERKVLGE